MLKVDLFHLRAVTFDLVDLLWKFGKCLKELAFVEAVVGLFAVPGSAFMAGEEVLALGVIVVVGSDAFVGRNVLTHSYLFYGF